MDASASHVASPSRVYVCTVLAAALLISDHYLGYSAHIRGALAWTVYPLRVVSSKPIAYLELLSGYIGGRRRLLEQNAQLQEQLVLLGGRLQRFETLEDENRRLRELLASSARLDERVRVAELVSMDLRSGHHQLVVNLGSREQAYAGQPLVDADGIVGQVLHTGPFTSTVLMITDARHALPVVLNRTGGRAVLEGTGVPDLLWLRYVADNVDVQKGDLVVSSGLGGRFPHGYPVARVKHIKRSPGGEFAEIYAEPTARLLQSRRFLLVWYGNPDGASAADIEG